MEKYMSLKEFIAKEFGKGFYEGLDTKVKEALTDMESLRKISRSFSVSLSQTILEERGYRFRKSYR